MTEDQLKVLKEIVAAEEEKKEEEKKDERTFSRGDAFRINGEIYVLTATNLYGVVFSNPLNGHRWGDAWEVKDVFCVTSKEIEQYLGRTKFEHLGKASNIFSLKFRASGEIGETHRN